MTITPRGIKNNNPGNIRYDGTNLWMGLDHQTPTDGAFCIFVDPKFGIRAMAKIQLNYQGRQLRTIGLRIDTWAPPGENDDTSYEEDVVARMSQYLGMPLRSYSDMDVTDIDVMRALLKAITWHENGECPYDDDVFDEGIRLAYASHPLTTKPALDGSIA